MELPILLRRYGLLYSEELEINLEEEPFKWFLASILFGGRISTTIAKNTYKVYDESGLTSPEKIVASSSKRLIAIHGRGGYVRYDGITADYIIGVAKKLVKEYGGDIQKLDEISRSPKDLERKLQDFRGVGPVTTKIFLRELRGLWENADPEPTSVEILAAKKMGILESKKNALQKLKRYWRDNNVEGYDFRNFEAALVRFGLELRREEN